MALNHTSDKKVRYSFSHVAILASLVVLLVACTGLFACAKAQNEQKATETAPEVSYIDKASGKYATGTHHAVIHVKDYGDIKVELNANAAPITVSNFANLAEKGFYNGLTFHRIIKGFMIQGGDPKGDGTGGSDKNIKGEFAANGVSNPIPHTRGVISMARSQDFNSASSQFFIVQEDADSLNGQYAAFGHVTDGMKVVDEICDKVKVGENGKVLSDPPVITSIEMID